MLLSSFFYDIYENTLMDPLFSMRKTAAKLQDRPRIREEFPDNSALAAASGNNKRRAASLSRPICIHPGAETAGEKIVPLREFSINNRGRVFAMRGENYL